MYRKYRGKYGWKKVDKIVVDLAKDGRPDLQSVSVVVKQPSGRG
jgi:hypothetical protein